MFIQMNVGDVHEPKPVAAGRYPLVIADAKFRPPKSEDKGPNIEVSIGIEGHIDAPNIRHFISLPKADDDEKKANFKKLMFKRFMAQFRVPYDESEGFNVEDMVGCTGEGQVALSEPDETTGNIYNRLVLDRLASEPEQG